MKFVRDIDGDIIYAWAYLSNNNAIFVYDPTCGHMIDEMLADIQYAQTHRYRPRALSFDGDYFIFALMKR